MSDLRSAARDLITREIAQATTDLVLREGESYEWMRGQQGFIRGLNQAIAHIDEAWHSLGSM